MTVCLETFVVGPAGEFHAGDYMELPADEAARFIERGMATAVEVIETAATRTTTAKGRNDARIQTARTRA